MVKGIFSFFFFFNKVVWSIHINHYLSAISLCLFKVLLNGDLIERHFFRRACPLLQR